MSEKPNLENWRQETDPVLDVKTEEGKTIKDDLQSVRDKHAEVLHGLRRERDEKRKEAESYEAESTKRSNKFLQYFRPKHHELNPAVLKGKADTSNEKADFLQKEAVYKKSILAHGRKEGALEIVDKAIDRTVASLDALYVQVSSPDPDPEEFNSLLESLPRDEIRKLIASDYQRKYKDTDTTALVVSKFDRIKDELEKNPFAMSEPRIKFDLYVKNLLLDEVRENEDNFKKTEAFIPMLRCLGRSTPPGEKRVLMEAIDQGLSFEFIDSLFYKQGGGKIVELLVSLNSKITIESLSVMIRQALEVNADHVAFNRLLAITWKPEEKPATSELIRKIVGPMLQKEFGILDGPETVSRWEGNADVDVAVNFLRMRKVDEQVAGGVKLLHEEYGICEFKRYPVEMMVDQVKVHEQDVPYGVVFFPEDDHNDAFDQDFKILQQLYEGTKGKHVTRVFEVSRGSSLMRHVATLRQKYNSKISYLILGAHGQESGMEFTARSPLNKRILDRSTSVPAIKDMFIEDPSVALFSCSTGVEGGFAQLLSEKLGARVQAPKIESGPDSLRVVYEGDKPILKVEFRKKDASEQAEYFHGLKEEA